MSSPSTRGMRFAKFLHVDAFAHENPPDGSRGVEGSDDTATTRTCHCCAPGLLIEQDESMLQVNSVRFSEAWQLFRPEPAYVVRLERDVDARGGTSVPQGRRTENSPPQLRLTPPKIPLSLFDARRIWLGRRTVKPSTVVAMLGLARQTPPAKSFLLFSLLSFFTLLFSPLADSCSQGGLRDDELRKFGQKGKRK